MRTIKTVIDLEISKQHEKAYEVALYGTREAWDMFQEYMDFSGELDDILNANYIK